jgi:K+-transporting ATPase ATPase C chain
MRDYISGLRLFIVMSVLTGILYPLAITGVAQCIFADKAQGSLIIVNGVVRGSTLIGQSFSNPGYFQARPSATGYSTMPSGGSNLNVAGNQLRDSVAAREKLFRNKYSIVQETPAPHEMLFTSASGLDPHISPQAAQMQIPAIVKERGLSSEQQKSIQEAVERFTKEPQFGILGEPRVAVVPLNLFLDKVFNNNNSLHSK